MLFNSLQFLVFLPTVLLLYGVVPGRYRALLLVFASCTFYMAFIPSYILILWLLIGIDYGAGLALAGMSDGGLKKAVLLLSLLSNLGILGFFKYWNFAVQNLAPWLSLPLQSFVLPIGLSFHTFQSMAYTIEVYRGNFPAERDFLRYSLYVLFFPQMVAGPIERPGGLLAQLQAGPRVDPQRVAQGLRLMLLGLTKKVMLADRLAPFVDATFNSADSYLGPRLWVATLFFSVQIYCDFSGYSDIACGVAKLLGYELCLNFKRPYAALNLGDFWRRWHISLSTWFRDYLYIPLGGNRAGRGRTLTNLFITFLISGLWHGANWTYVIWGALHGLGVAVHQLSRGRLPAPVGWLLTWLWTLLAWVFFRARDLQTAAYVIGCGAVSGGSSPLGPDPVDTGLNLMLVVAFMVYELIAEYRLGMTSERWLASRPAWLRYLLYASLVLGTLLLGRFRGQQFVYFQF